MFGRGHDLSQTHPQTSGLYKRFLECRSCCGHANSILLFKGNEQEIRCAASLNSHDRGQQAVLLKRPNDRANAMSAGLFGVQEVANSVIVSIDGGYKARHGPLQGCHERRMVPIETSNNPGRIIQLAHEPVDFIEIRMRGTSQSEDRNHDPEICGLACTRGSPVPEGVVS